MTEIARIIKHDSYPQNLESIIVLWPRLWIQFVMSSNPHSENGYANHLHVTSQSQFFIHKMQNNI